jgi:putative hemolysin
VRLANSRTDIEAAQALRYRVFYEELGAHPSRDAVRTRLDFDDFDGICDHLLVIADDKAEVVGTYRLLRREIAERHHGFYSADEFDIRPLLGGGEIMELGRSCIDVRHRNRPILRLLWQAIAEYVCRYDISLLFGCASLPGGDARAHALALSYLHHFYRAPPGLRPTALVGRHIDMNMLPREQIDPGYAFRALPPLIRGYLRLGGLVGDGAVSDIQFNTTDVAIVLKTGLMTKKYSRHYERTAHIRPA